MKHFILITPMPSPFVEAIIVKVPSYAPGVKITPIFYADSSHRPDWGTSGWPGITIDPKHKKASHEAVAVVEKLKPDGVLLSGYGGKIQWAVRKWSIRNKKPFFMVLSEAPSPAEGLKRILRRRIIHRFLSGCSGVSCMGPRAVQEYSSVYRGPIIETPYAFDIAPLLEHERPRSNGDKGLTFLFSGRLTAQRNPLLVLAAFSKLNQQYKETRLIFSGRGPLEGAINERVENLGLQHAVSWMNSFSGWHDIMNFYRHGDVLVSCSNFNTWNLPIQEAMASGLGIVATWTTEAATALIVNEYNGFLIRPSHQESLYRAMLGYVENPQLAQTHGKRSREMVPSVDAARVAERLGGLLKNSIG